jgi:plastocyanin
MPVPRRLIATTAGLPLAFVLAGTLAACSGSSSANRQPHQGSGTASVVNGVQQLTLHASDFRFSPSTITVHPGKVRIILVNDGGGAPHNFQVPVFPAEFIPLTSNGQQKQATFTAPAPGTYQFVCTIHLKQGMDGKLVVLPD